MPRGDSRMLLAAAQAGAILAIINGSANSSLHCPANMYVRLANRLFWETDKRLLWKLVWNFGLKGIRSVQRHKARLRRGEFFPPFLYISVINSCNLRCQGCWVDVGAKQSRIE